MLKFFLSLLTLVSSLQSSQIDIKPLLGKPRAAYEAALGTPTKSERNESRETTDLYFEKDGLRFSVSVLDEGAHVSQLTVHFPNEWTGDWKAALEAVGLSAEGVKGIASGSAISLRGVAGVAYANWYEWKSLAIGFPEPPKVYRTSTVSPQLVKTFRAIIGSKSEGAIVKQMNGIAPALGGFRGTSGKGSRTLSYSVGNGGGAATMKSPLGKLPVGIFYVERGSKGKGPAYIKLTFLQNPEPKNALGMVSQIAGPSRKLLSFGPLLKFNGSKCRKILGTKYVIYAVGWSTDPKVSTSQLVIGTRDEPLVAVTMS